MALWFVSVPLRAQGVSPLVAQELVATHNAARALVGSPPLLGSPALARVAQRWADHLLMMRALAHQTNSPYGENLLLIAG